jgi:hypothetical protein
MFFLIAIRRREEKRMKEASRHARKPADGAATCCFATCALADSVSVFTNVVTEKLVAIEY